MKHKFKTGNTFSRKHSEETAVAIIKMLQQGLKQRTVARRLGCPQSTVSDIGKGKSWKQLPR